MLLLVSILIGGLAALAALGIASLTSATLSPVGAALLGAAFVVTPRRFARATRPGGFVTALVHALLAGGTAFLLTTILQRS